MKQAARSSKQAAITAKQLQVVVVIGATVLLTTSISLQSS